MLCSTLSLQSKGMRNRWSPRLPHGVSWVSESADAGAPWGCIPANARLFRGMTDLCVSTAGKKEKR